MKIDSLKRPLITVFFNHPHYDDYPFDIEEYRIAYAELATSITERGATFGIVRSQKTYLGNNTFQGGWIFDGSKFMRTEEILETNLIYDKGHFSSDKTARLLNPIELDELCTDKWVSYQKYKKFCPATFVAMSAGEVPGILQKIPTEKIVAKPVDGFEGRGVIIGQKEDVAAKIERYPYMICAFMDTTKGIPGLVEGPHDLRIVGIRGEIGVSYIRTPPKGSLRANVSKGGKEIEVPLDHIPKGAMELFHTIDATLEQYPYRVYSVDMGLDADGSWKLFELNSKPALSARSTGKSYIRFEQLMADALIAAAKR
jgi:glutathione synthase/RimK-type ligase-like ATP-grasp enzyme